MTKIAYWIVVIVLIALAVIGLLVYQNYVTGTTPTQTAPYTNPYSYPDDSSNSPITTPNDFTLATSNGGIIQTKNFVKDPTTKSDPINNGQYYLGYHFDEVFNDTTASAAPPYVINYIESTQYFSIALLQEPIGLARQAAEQYLMRHLGINQSQMCQLKYMVSTPASVDSTYTATSLGFSFCAGSTQLPQ